MCFQVLLVSTWFIIAGWRDANKWLWLVNSSISFFVGHIIPMDTVAILLVFRIHKRITLINWPFTVSFPCMFEIAYKLPFSLFSENRTTLKMKFGKKHIDNELIGTYLQNVLSLGGMIFC